ncbi:MAG: efflux RND transporter periplasmic adaptor subunit [Betaproteobacteria bacterium]
MPHFACPSAAGVRLDAVALVIAATMVVAGCSKEVPAPERPVPQVVVQTIEPVTIPYIANFVAQTESSRQVNIVARVSGFLDRIAYQEGELIKQGALMFLLDPKPFQAQFNAAMGELQSQQARYTTAQATYGRVKPLADQDALPLSDLDKAKGELDAAKAAVFSAQAKVEQAQLNLGYATITSPVTGVASRSLQRQGAFVNAAADSAFLTYVAALDPIWVNFNISQNQMAKYKEWAEKGQVIPPKGDNYTVEIVLPGGAIYPYRGTIGFADPSFSQDTGSFLVRAVLPNPKLDLRPGMFVTANVKGSMRPNAIVVPQLAVQQGSNGHFVYVIGATNVTEVRPVIVGDFQGDKDIVITNGLHKGDRVVIDGILKVVPGKPVTVAPPAPSTAAPGATAAPATAPTPVAKPATAAKK